MEGKHLCGIYRAICTNANDPQLLGRIKVQIPDVLGTSETDWIYGGVGGGSPDVGDGVWVAFEAGDPDHPVWIGVFWNKP